MRIIFIGYLHGEGGIQTHQHWLAKGLAARGHNVEIFTSKPMRGNVSNLPRETPYTIVEYNSLFDLLYFARKQQVSLDALVVTGLGWKAMLLALAIPNVKRRIFFEVMSGERNSKPDPRDMVHLGFDTVVSQGQGVKQTFSENFKWYKEHVVIPALPEPLEIRCAVPPAPQLPHSKNGKLRLAYFGRLVPYKGVGFLIDNWDQLSVHADHLDIWGTGAGYDEFANKINALGLQDRIKLSGRYPHGEDYVKLIQSYDMVLLPTWGKEGAPLVLLESMVSGIPFVANGVGGIPDYTNSNCSITSGDISEFLLCYEILAKRVRSGGLKTDDIQQHYHKNFGYQKLLDRWEQILEDQHQPVESNMVL
jgi:glycosyltransferase involved in cell wall biosynthesis